MKKLFLFITFLLSVAVFSQNQQLADNYFEKGEFEKALVIYESLIEKSPRNISYAQQMVACYQQLEQYDKAEKILKEKIEQTKQPMLVVDLGYNYQLQNDTIQAKKYYNRTI